MARKPINTGSNANVGDGDTLRAAFIKVEDNFTELYASPLFSGDILISGNEISATRSNDDLILRPSGTGSVKMDSLTVDDNIQITDNTIKTTVSNSDLELSASGTGTVLVRGNIDVNGGNIDDTVIGGSTAVAGTFTTATATTSATINNITISNNTITINASNTDLNLTANGSGNVSISGFKFPSSDGSTGQFLKTDGAGNLGFATAGTTLNHSDIADSTVTVSSSATAELNKFDSTVHRSARYFISVSDVTNNRFEFIEANLVFGPSADSTIEAFLTVFGSVTNHTTSLVTLSADVLNGEVRLLANTISNNAHVFKIQRVAIDV